MNKAFLAFAVCCLLIQPVLGADKPIDESAAPAQSNTQSPAQAQTHLDMNSPNQALQDAQLRLHRLLTDPAYLAQEYAKKRQELLKAAGQEISNTLGPRPSTPKGYRSFAQRREDFLNHNQFSWDNAANAINNSYLAGFTPQKVVSDAEEDVAACGGKTVYEKPVSPAPQGGYQNSAGAWNNPFAAGWAWQTGASLAPTLPHP